MSRFSPERTEQEWLDNVRVHALCGDLDTAQAILLQALNDYPQSRDLAACRRAFASSEDGLPNRSRVAEPAGHQL